MPESKIFLTFGFAVIYGLVVLVGSIIAIQRSMIFKRRWFWWLLFIAFANCFLQPFVYMWMTSYNVSFMDAVLMRTFYAGSWHVAEGYAVFLGLAVGGLIGFGLSKK